MDNIKEIEKRRSEELLSKYRFQKKEVRRLKMRLWIKENITMLQIILCVCCVIITGHLIYWGFSTGSSWSVAFFVLLSFIIWDLVLTIIHFHKKSYVSKDELRKWIQGEKRIMDEAWNDYQLVQKGSIDGSRVTEPLDK